MKPRIVKAQIGPMNSKDIRLSAAMSSLLPVEILVDPKHPITKALMEQLPRLSDDDLNKVKAHMTTYNGRVNAMSKLEDVESWIALVDEEIRVRKVNQQKAVLTVLQLLTGPSS